MKIEYKTGEEWCNRFGIAILDKLTKGFGSQFYFYNTPITKSEFFNRVADCKLSRPDKVSRIQAEQFRQFLAS